MRSVVVVLPASMWAMIPMLRTRSGAPLRHLDGRLVVRAAAAPGANLQQGSDGFDRLLEHLDRRLAGLLPDPVQRGVDDLLGCGLLPARHDLVDDLGDELRVVDGIRIELADLDFGAPWHQLPLFAPYLERPCLRSVTPAESSAARI